MVVKRLAWLSSLLLAAALLAHGGSFSSAVAHAGTAPGPAPVGTSAARDLMFIENRGQFDRAAAFQGWGGKETLWLTKDTIWVSLSEPSGSRGGNGDLPAERGRIDGHSLRPALSSSMPSHGAHIRITFPGASPNAQLEPFGRLDTHVSYFHGADAAGWQPDVPAWRGVRYSGLYPGMDLELTEEDGLWTWRLHARTEPEGSDTPSGVSNRDFVLRVEGADDVAVNRDTLRLATSAGEVVLPLLATEGWQAEGTHIERLGAQTFDVRPSIAPEQGDRHAADAASQSGALVYGTYFGGAGVDYSYGIAAEAGALFITGYTPYYSSLPTTPGAFDPNYNGGGDAFVAKFNATGGLAYATFLGGKTEDYGGDITVDPMGSAYVTGGTRSSDFPTTPGAFDTVANRYRYWDGYLVKLNPTGTALDYATLVGGEGYDLSAAVAVDHTGSAYVTGYTDSEDFPTTPGAFDTSYSGTYAAFVAKVDPAGKTLVYGTFLSGSTGWHIGEDIVVDAAGRAWVTGYAASADFPVTPGALDTSYNGDGDAFVARLNPTGSALLYATFLGGTGDDEATGIAIDVAGSVYVAGDTRSSDFPVTPGAFQTAYGGAAMVWERDVFVARLSPAGDRLSYATYLGGARNDVARGLAVDAAGGVYVAGATSSANFPSSPDALDPGFDGGTCSHPPCADAYLARLNPAGSRLVYGTFLGGNGDDWGTDLVLDDLGRACVTGATASSDFPVTSDAFDSTINGGPNSYDAYALRLVAGLPLPPPSLAGTVAGTVWYDLDGDGVRTQGEPGLSGVGVRLFWRGVQIGQTTTSSDGRYAFASLEPDEYIVVEMQPHSFRYSSTANKVELRLAEGGKVLVNFGDWNGRPVDYDVAYDASTGLLPNESCPRWTLADTAIAEDPVVSAGRLTISTSQGSENIYYIQTEIEVRDPLIVEARVRRLSGSTYSDERAPIAVAFTTNPNVGNALYIGRDEIFLLAGNLIRGETAVVDTDDGFHNYRIEVGSSGAIQVFYDDVLKLTGTTFNHAGANGPIKRVIWGELSILAYGASEWQTVRHNAGIHGCASMFLPLITHAQ